MNASKIKAFAVVTLVTVLIWLYAESESRRVVDLLATIHIPREVAGDRIAWAPYAGESFEISLQLDGTTAAIDELRQIVTRQGLDLSQSDNFPNAPGDYTANLRNYLRSHPALRRRGVEVISTNPESIFIEIDEAERRSMQIALPELPGVQIESPRFDPPAATIVLPGQFAERLAGARLVADVLPSQVAVPPGSNVTIPGAELKLRGDNLPPIFSIEPPTTTVSLVIRAQTRSYVVPTVPVHLRAPPSVLQEWDIQIDGPAFLTEVEITGPLSEIEPYTLDPADPRFKPLFAYVTVLPDDADRGVTEKRAQFSDFPLGQIQVKVASSTIRLRYTRRPDPASPNDDDPPPPNDHAPH